MTLRHFYLEQLGIESWVLRQPKALPSPLEQLAKAVAACTGCPLHMSRTQTVFSRGNPDAKLMIIGEAPGFHEDQQGLPFVGKAGNLLNNMIQSIGLNQDQIYIANILKCRPPENRDPQLNEITQCSPYLAQQIALIKPSLILAVGRFAGQYLLNTTLSLTKMRAKIHDYHGIKVIVSYHPAYLLRHPIDKKKAYQDWVTTKKLITQDLDASYVPRTVRAEERA